MSVEAATDAAREQPQQSLSTAGRRGKSKLWKKLLGAGHLVFEDCESKAAAGSEEVLVFGSSPIAATGTAARGAGAGAATMTAGRAPPAAGAGCRDDALPA